MINLFAYFLMNHVFSLFLSKSRHGNLQRINHFKPNLNRLNIISEYNLYLKDNTVHLRHNDQLVNAV